MLATLFLGAVVWAVSGIAWFSLATLRLIGRYTPVDPGLIHEWTSHGMLIGLGLMVIAIGFMVWGLYSAHQLQTLRRAELGDLREERREEVPPRTDLRRAA